MTGYQYTYPLDTSFIDEATQPGRVRDASYRIIRSTREDGGDLWDAVEDDRDLSDDEKNQVHRVFGSTDSDAEIAAKRAAGVRYDW